MKLTDVHAHILEHSRVQIAEVRRHVSSQTLKPHEIEFLHMLENAIGSLESACLWIRQRKHP